MTARAEGRCSRLRRLVASVRLRAALGLGTLLGFGAVGTSAYWLDADTVAPGTVTSGVLHLDLGGQVRVKPETFAWTSLTATAIYPGASLAAVLPVANNATGGLALDYRVAGRATSSSGTVTDPGLVVTLRRGGTVSGGTCTGGTLLGPSGGTRLTSADQPLAASAQRLASGAADQLCVQVAMAINTPNTVQGTTATVRLTFSATGVRR